MKNQNTIKVEIESLGQNGDGVAFHQGQKIYVPRTLQGELVEVQLKSASKAECMSVEKPSAHRIPPVCPHYESCGSCTLQHMDEESYRDFKRQKVEEELRRHQIMDVDVDSALFIPPHSRRRVTFKVQNSGGKILLGYFLSQSHQLSDISQCLVVTPDIEEMIIPLKTLLKEVLPIGMKGEVKLTSTETGLDVVLYFQNSPSKQKKSSSKQKQKRKSKVSLNAPHAQQSHGFEMTLEVRETLSQFAKNHHLARLSVQQEGFLDPVVCHRVPMVSFSGISVPVSAESFLQASVEADTHMAKFIHDALTEHQQQKAHSEKESFKIADLFSGRGTLTFPLAKWAHVQAYEADKPSLDILAATSRENGLKAEGILRNLFEDPLSVTELNAFDVVVMDPPRVGASAQCQQLAVSAVPLVLSISCNPATFARDAKMLIGGGYNLKHLVLLDQFIFTPHVEVMAIFEKG